MYRFGGIFCVDSNTHMVLVINGLYSLFLALEYFLFHSPLLRLLLLFSRVSCLSVDLQVTVNAAFCSTCVVALAAHISSFLGFLSPHPRSFTWSHFFFASSPLLVSCAWIFICNIFCFFFKRSLFSLRVNFSGYRILG